MINSLREKDFQAKQENSTKDSSKLLQPTTNTISTTTSRQWAGFKNPRIVRVSRTFGGKDRHSKVCTIRGLRDRRIRLSVPTAIQLYDLQDRLGLSQPSKVVDWLLDATKDEIDKLPPLQMPPGNFAQYFHQPNLIDHRDQLPPFFNMNNSDGGTQALFHRDNIGGIKINDQDDEQRNLRVSGKSKHWNLDSSSSSRGKCKEVETETIDVNKWMTSSNEQGNHGANREYMAQLSAHNFFPVGNESFPSLIPFNSYTNQWEPSNLSLSQFGTQGFQSHSDPQTAHHFLSPLALPSASQLFLAPTIFPQYSVDQTDPRQFNHFQHAFQNSLVPNLQLISPLNMYPKAHAQDGEESQQDKSEGGS